MKKILALMVVGLMTFGMSSAMAGSINYRHGSLDMYVDDYREKIGIADQGKGGLSGWNSGLGQFGLNYDDSVKYVHHNGKRCKAVHGATADFVEDHKFWDRGNWWSVVKVRITSGEFTGCVGWLADRRFYRN